MRAVARRRPLRNRLAVLATNSLDIIENVGGWLFDQSLAGWDVTVHVLDDDPDPRPLGILGARAFPLEKSMVGTTTGRPWPQALAIATSVFESDERIRSGTLSTVDRHLADVRVWGRDLPTELDGRCTTVSYRPTAAARAFKRRAFEAAHLAPETASDMEFFGTAPVPATPVGSHLTPAG